MKKKKGSKKRLVLTKRQKKQILGIVMISLGICMIVNFARLDQTIFPVLLLDFEHYGLSVISGNLNWPFKLLNYFLYKMLGYPALIVPIVLFMLAITFFTQRESEKLTRKRVIYLWGIAQFTFLVYYIHYVSFVIIPDRVSPGVIALVFARYLNKVGGFAFITLFFIWSVITYILYIVKSNWKEFFHVLWHLIKSTLIGFTHLISRILDAKQKEKKSLKSGTEKKVTSGQKQIENKRETPEVKREVKKERNERKEKNEKREGAAKTDIPVTSPVHAATKEETEAKPEDIIDVEFKPVIIDEFDSTTKGLTFEYDVLSENSTYEVDAAEHEALGAKIEETFGGLGVVLRKAGLTIGPRLVRFEYDFPEGIQLKEIEKYEKELSYRLGGIDVDIEVPIFGTDKFGIYVGRKKPDVLGMGSYLTGLEERSEKVPLFIGVQPDGSSLWTDASQLPHLLIAGTTGSGKSVFLNNIIVNLMAVSCFVPVNIVLVDPKRVEFSPYKTIPQLSHQIITDVDEARTVLIEAERLMDERYDRITEHSVRNIAEYNDCLDRGFQKMSYLFIIIDEFADLVMQDAPGQIKKSIIRLAQKSRAVGIHVILATQRPSTDVIDGLIKANFPSRIAFKTSSKVDSRIILDENGAEHLLGKGDMVARLADGEKSRLQGIFIDIQEIKKIAAP